MPKIEYFTSESVTEGHPDKLCDQISDAILDELYRQDPYSRVAVETLTTTGLVICAGEVTTKGFADVQKIVRQTLKEIGYTDPQYGIDCEDAGVLVSIHGQSPDIAQGVDEGEGIGSRLGGRFCDHPDVGDVRGKLRDHWKWGCLPNPADQAICELGVRGKLQPVLDIRAGDVEFDPFHPILVAESLGQLAVVLD